MKNRIGYLILLSALAVSNPALAMSRQGQDALNAFRRYEPEFSNTLRNLQELDRKLSTFDEDENASKASEIKLSAEELMAKIEDRYDAMEDLYNITVKRNPGDQLELQDGFNRLDDIYRQVRDFYAEKYTYRDENNSKKSSEASEELTDVTETSKENTVISENYNDAPYYVEPLQAEDYKLILASDQAKKRNRFEVKGSLLFDYRNADEKHQSFNRKNPNDQTQGRMLLTYKIDEDRQLALEERYLTRERNEKIKENHLTLSYFTKHGDNSGFTVRDKLQHVWYPDNSNKNYRTNLLEGVYTKNYSNEHERVVTGSIKTKRYSKNSNSDYNQYSIGDEESWNKRNTSIFTEFKSDFVKYRNVGNLDYNNFNVYAELNKTYSGNKADLKIADTYDRRIYDTESIAAYRTSYYDNFLQLGYELPVNDKVTYNFEGEYTKHNFSSDEPRGYAQLDVFNEVIVKTDDRTFVRGDYRYVYNDENTRSSAHKNNIIHIGWTRNVNKDYKIMLNETYHDRNSVENGALDFKANTFTAELNWRIKNDYRLAWNTEHYQRKYDSISLGVADYRYLESGFDISYSKRKDYDWRISQKWRKIGYRNWGGEATGWNNRVQPVTEIKYHKWLTDDLKLGVRAAWEKTYYREYNNDSQELEYQFNDLMYNKEIYASLEYIF